MVSTPDEPDTPGQDDAPEPDAAASTPAGPPQGYPPGYGPPAGYGAGYGPPPGSPPLGEQLPAYQRTGPGIGIGIGIGAGLVVIAFILMMTTLGTGFGESLFGLVWPFVVIPVLVALLYFLPKWRMVTTGVLIMFASVWLIVLGPCVILLTGLGSF